MVLGAEPVDDMAVVVVLGPDSAGGSGSAPFDLIVDLGSRPAGQWPGSGLPCLG